VLNRFLYLERPHAALTRTENFFEPVYLFSDFTFLGWNQLLFLGRGRCLSRYVSEYEDFVSAIPGQPIAPWTLPETFRQRTIQKLRLTVFVRTTMPMKNADLNCFKAFPKAAALKTFFNI
jgi:hypothetical protein